MVLCSIWFSVPSVLWHCWLGHLTRKNPSPYKLYCVGGTLNLNQSLTTATIYRLTTARQLRAVQTAFIQTCPPDKYHPNETTRLACGTLFRSSCTIQTSSRRQLKGHFFREAWTQTKKPKNKNKKNTWEIKPLNSQRIHEIINWSKCVFAFR